MKYTNYLKETPLAADEIKQNIVDSDEFTIVSMMVLYEHQTRDEKSNGSTTYENSIGFNKVDSNICSSIAEWYSEKGFLTEKQMIVMKKRLIKYSKQLSKISRGLIRLP